MSRVIAVTIALMKNWLRSKSGLFFSFLFPVMLLLVFGAIFGGTNSSSYGIYYQNLDTNSKIDSPLSTQFLQAINTTKAFTLTRIPSNVDPRIYITNRTGALNGNTRILIIPKGFESDVLNGTLKVQLGISLNAAINYYTLSEATLNATEKTRILNEIALLNQSYTSIQQHNATLRVILDPSDQSGPVVKSIIGSVSNAFNYGLVGATNVIRFEEEVFTVRKFRTIDYYVPGLIAAFIMTNGVIGVTGNSTEFKRRGIIKRLATTPLTKLDWIVGNILSQTVINFLLTAIMVAIGKLVFNVEAIPDAFSIMMIFSGSAMFSGIGMALSGFIKDVEAASAVGNAITFPMMFLSGTYWPIEFMPQFLQSISKAMPLTYFSDGLRNTMIYQSLPAAVMDFSVVLALAALFIGIGVLVTKWREK